MTVVITIKTILFIIITIIIIIIIITIMQKLHTFQSDYCTCHVLGFY